MRPRATTTGNVTADAKRAFEARYGIDATRGERVEVALDCEGILHVHVVKVADGQLPDKPIYLRFTA